MREEVLRMTKVTYREQGGTLLMDFSLNVFEGEIMGFIPLNDSHVMTALSELLRRNFPIEAGNIYYCERLLNSWRSPSPHYNHIGVIQKNSSLMEGMTVADNIFVLRPGFKSWVIRPRIMKDQLQPYLDRLDVGVSADDYVENLSNFQKFIVELVKAIVAGCKFIILQDLGSFISDMEIARMNDILKSYAKRGISFLCMGFHNEELIQICDRTAFYSNGRIVKILSNEDPNIPQVKTYNDMVRRQLQQMENGKEISPVLSVRQLSCGAIENLSFDVAPGECVVLQDLQNRIFEDLIGLFLGDREIERGKILLDGEPFKPAGDRRIAVITERPDLHMLFPRMSYLDNLCLTIDHRLPEIWRSSRVQDGLKREYISQTGEELFDLPIERLSKPQKYDLVYQRILLQNPKAVFCVQPFVGADLEMRIHIWKLMEMILNKGIALIVLAVNLADSLSLASRLIRIKQGAVPEVYERSDFARIPFTAPWLDLYKDSGLID